jgi:methanethiol S-methyltransferase
MIRFFGMLYGVVVYLFFLVTFLYAIAFAGNFAVPKTIDSGTPGPMTEAVIIDLLLLVLFAVQHSVMARPGFKRWWTRIVPESIERSTYVLLSTLALALICWQWRPIPDPVWTVQAPVAVAIFQASFWFGWALLLTSTFLINHFELFGLRQVIGRLFGWQMPVPAFRTPFLYKYVRHPIYLGFLLGFWSTPAMTVGHLLFAATTTIYILIAIQFEERDLIDLFGEHYRRYRRRVAMIIPLPRRADEESN